MYLRIIGKIAMVSKLDFLLTDVFKFIALNQICFNILSHFPTIL